MKVSKEKAAENRELVLDTAVTLFRQVGFDGVGVADIMKQAGLTVGGFYNNFESKEDLIAQACDKLGEKSLKRWQEHIDNPDIADPLKRIGTSYLSTKNRDELSSTCIFSTLASEVPRHDAAVQQVFAQGVESTIQLLSTLVEGQSDTEKRNHAIAMFSQWLGALILSRAASASPLSDEILAVARKASNLE
jgi:TetR/AcrR family transcriptional repressor of nem operon